MRCALMSYLSIDWLGVLSSAYGSTARQMEPANFMLGLPFCVYMSVFHMWTYHCCYFRATRQTVPNIWLPTSAIWNWVSSPCDNLGRSPACLSLGEFVLDVCRIQWIYIAPQCRQKYNGLSPVVFSQCNGVRDFYFRNSRYFDVMLLFHCVVIVIVYCGQVSEYYHYFS